MAKISEELTFAEQRQSALEHSDHFLQVLQILRQPQL